MLSKGEDSAVILFAATYTAKAGTELNVFQCNEWYRKNELLSMFIVKNVFLGSDNCNSLICNLSCVSSSPNNFRLQETLTTAFDWGSLLIIKRYEFPVQFCVLNNFYELWRNK